MVRSSGDQRLLLMSPYYRLGAEYAPSIDEEGSKMAFELIFAFDEAISLGHEKL